MTQGNRIARRGWAASLAGLVGALGASAAAPAIDAAPPPAKLETATFALG